MVTTHIVIVNYNAGDWLLRSTGSALGSSANAVTIVDNNSTDQSVATAKATFSDGRLRYLENSSNLGFAAANNQVLGNLKEDYAILLNPDCELHEDSLQSILSAFAQYPRLGLASCRIVDEKGVIQKSSKRRFPTPWSALVRMLKLHKLFPNNSGFADFDYASASDSEVKFETVEAVSGAFMVVRRDAMTEVGLLDEAYFMHCEDLDWCKRFQIAGWQVGYVGEAVVTHAKGVSSKSRPVGVLWNLHRGMARFFDKFYCDQTNWLLRITVKLGIYISFAMRAVVGFLRARLP